MRPVSFENLFIDDFYWYFQFRSQRVNTLPVIWNRLVGQGLAKGEYTARDIEDADLYQLLETMSYIYVVEPDSLMKGRIDSLAALVSDKIATKPDYTLVSRSRKDAHPRDYQLAAFYRAALAYTRAGGQRNLLDWALQSARNLSEQVLRAPGKLKEHHLHPNMVLALGDFFLLTQNETLLQAAGVMLEQMNGLDWGEEQGLLYAAQALYGSLTSDRGILETNQAQWLQAVNRTMRITGGFSVRPEALPSTAFSIPETMANMEWCLRLYEATRDARYMELYERAMYNELRAGISFHGGYMARNLTIDSEQELERDTISQVPLAQVIPLMRGLAVLPDHYYSTWQDTAVYVNQYFRGEVTIKTRKLNMKLSTMSSMPWSGGFYLDVVAEQPQQCTFYLRMPAWMTDDCLEGVGRYRFVPSKKHMYLTVNGINRPLEVENGFLKVSGTWKNNDRIIFYFLASPRKVLPKQDAGSDTTVLAHQYSTFVFCQEEADSLMEQHKEHAVCLTDNLANSFALGLMGGVRVLEGKQYECDGDSVTDRPLWLTPYFARGQRGIAKTKIWFPYFTKDKQK